MTAKMWIAAIALALFAQGCGCRDAGTDSVTQNRVTTHTAPHLDGQGEAPENGDGSKEDAEAVELIKQLLAVPYAGHPMLGGRYALSEKPEEDDDEYWDGREEFERLVVKVAEKAGPESVEVLLDAISDGFDKDFWVDWACLGSLKGSRAFSILQEIKRKDSLAKALLRHLESHTDPYLTEVLFTVASTLPKAEALEIFGTRLTDTRECRPKTWKRKMVQGIAYTRQNRVCDSAYKRMRSRLEDGFNVGQEDSLPQEQYERHLATFREWWAANKARITAGEEVPIHERQLGEPGT